MRPILGYLTSSFYPLKKKRRSIFLTKKKKKDELSFGATTIIDKQNLPYKTRKKVGPTYPPSEFGFLRFVFLGP